MVVYSSYTYVLVICIISMLSLYLATANMILHFSPLHIDTYVCTILDVLHSLDYR